jgi:hypothetical protein
MTPRAILPLPALAACTLAVGCSFQGSLHTGDVTRTSAAAPAGEAEAAGLGA